MNCELDKMMKMSDIGFRKPIRTNLASKFKNSVSAVWFSTTDFGGLGTVFQVV